MKPKDVKLLDLLVMLWMKQNLGGVVSIRQEKKNIYVCLDLLHSSHMAQFVFHE